LLFDIQMEQWLQSGKRYRNRNRNHKIIMKKERTEAHKTARLAAEDACISLERLTMKAISSGLFINPMTKEKYSLSWVNNRLRHDDSKVASKLEIFAKTL
jgi:hypothetical protein